MNIDNNSISALIKNSTDYLLNAKGDNDCWQGHLSSSPLATATAVVALHLCEEARSSSVVVASKPTLTPYVDGGLDWLVRVQNRDGGWGDTLKSESNISTTLLCWAALSMQKNIGMASAITSAEQWITNITGDMQSDSLIEGVLSAYGDDHTFSVPILTHCVLTGCFGDERAAFKKIPQLPFELSILPRKLFRFLKMPVVSYAMPALIAFGYVRHCFRPSKNPLLRLLRALVKGRTLTVLNKIQPSNGGFLEAIPLTSFVVMSLVKSQKASSHVVDLGIDFLIDCVREKSHWPIDTHLATWVTTLSVNALLNKSVSTGSLDRGSQGRVVKWLLDQQYQVTHRYSGAAPGGWSWTDAPGGVPDSDDTAGALLALWHLDKDDQDVIDAATKGVKWLVGVQNKDGGIPTFCAGWTNLPFDRSTPELTAHVLLAWNQWQPLLTKSITVHLEKCIERALLYLENIQSPSGYWLPLWFGNQYAPNHENPIYGTSKVLISLCQLETNGPAVPVMRHRAFNWLLSVQNCDGGFGGNKDVASSIEETALGVDALSHVLYMLNNEVNEQRMVQYNVTEIKIAISKGIAWLDNNTNNGTLFEPTPIGLYFAKLWYWEELYPVIFTVSAVTTARRVLKK